MTKKQEKLLEIKNLAIHFENHGDTVKAVNGINFFLNKGEILGIVGESGSGKSVTALSIMQLLSDTSKEIKNGQIIYTPTEDQSIDLLKLAPAEIRAYRGKEIAMIFQESMTALNPVLTCGEQILEAILVHQPTNKNATEYALSLLKQVKLQDTQRVFDAYPHQLSGGQKQRIMIAIAIASQPNILIADEPTTALDVAVQQSIIALLKKLKTQLKTSMIFITHDLGVIAEIADRVLVMYKGEIVEQGTVAELFSQPKHPYTKGLLACRPSLDVRLKRLPVIEDFMETVINDQGEIILKEKANAAIFENNEISKTDYDKRQAALKQKQPLLKVNGLNTWYPNKKNWYGKIISHTKAVNDVSFEVYEGETLGLVGESGCGKTTLGRTILRLIDQQSGTVEFAGQSLFQLSETQMKTLRKDMQIIFQDPYSSLNPRQTIGDAIAEPIRIHNLASNETELKDKVLALLKTVTLPPSAYHRYPHEFSGGQRQRICIARALAVNPKFIVCDEVVSALDVSVQAQILNLLLELREKFNLTYIFISHDLAVVKQMSDRIIVMNNGKIEKIS